MSGDPKNYPHECERWTLPKTDLSIEDARRKLAGWHFSQESLSVGERQILYVAEALLRCLDDVMDCDAPGRA